MGVTFKEYAWLINPNLLKNSEIGGVEGCPEGYGFEEHWCDGHGMISCADCWNREISYPVIAKAVRQTEIYPIHKAMPGDEFQVCEVDMNTYTRMGVRIIVNGSKFWTNHGDFRYYIDKEEKKVQKEFTKADLKDGMMCERADGKKMLWFNGEMRGIDKWCSGTQSNLTNPGREDLSIVRVGYPDFDKHTTISHALNGEFKEILWERKQEKEISSEEAFAVLKEHYGCDVKIKE